MGSGTQLIDDIGAGPVGLDSAIFIYFVEDHAEFGPMVEAVFAAMDRGRLLGVTSTVTLLETLVVPYRAGALDLVHRYEAFLTRGRGLSLVDIDRRLLHAAAQLRARFRIGTPDALQIAAALRSGCSTFVTNDRALPPVPGLRILQLSWYHPPP